MFTHCVRTMRRTLVYCSVGIHGVARPEEDPGMSNLITNTATIGSNACERTYSIGASLSQNLVLVDAAACTPHACANQTKSHFPEFSTECTLLRLQTAEATGIFGGETTHTHMCVSGKDGNMKTMLTFCSRCVTLSVSCNGLLDVQGHSKLNLNHRC